MSEWRATLDERELALPIDRGKWYKKYGVTFRDVARDDLELLRRWRNHPEVRRYMVFREEITPEMQLRWFASIDGERDKYSIVRFRDEDVGITQLRNIDPSARSAEGGITLWRPEDQGGLLSYRVSLAGMDWNFLALGFERLEVTVRKDNTRARRFVRSLGYRLRDPDPAGETLHGTIDPASYFRTVRTWRSILHDEMGALREPVPEGF